jgi:hypothetical protein
MRLPAMHSATRHRVQWVFAAAHAKIFSSPSRTAVDKGAGGGESTARILAVIPNADQRRSAIMQQTSKERPAECRSGLLLMGASDA